MEDGIFSWTFPYFSTFFSGSFNGEHDFWNPFWVFLGYPSFGQITNHRLHCWWYNSIIFPFHCGLNKQPPWFHKSPLWLVMHGIFFFHRPSSYICIVITIPFHCGSIPPIIMNIIDIIYNIIIVVICFHDIPILSPFLKHCWGSCWVTPTKRSVETPTTDHQVWCGEADCRVETHHWKQTQYLGDTWAIPGRSAVSDANTDEFHGI